MQYWRRCCCVAFEGFPHARFFSYAKYTLLVVGALFPIVNPIGNTPIFLSLTSGLPEFQALPCA